MDAQSSVVKWERLANRQCTWKAQGAGIGDFAGLGLSQNLLGDVCGDGNAEPLSLVRFEH
jgi:hypothetical protein